MRPGLAILLGALAACGSSGATSIELDVTYDPGWQLTGFTLDAHDATTGGAHHTHDEDASSKLLVLVPDGWAGHKVDVELTGLRGAARAATGSVEVTPVRGRVVTIRLPLQPLGCSDACTQGATECAAGGVATCVRGGDGCTTWGAPVACTGGTSCSLGRCTSSCVSECADGETICDGRGGVRTCGQADADSCLDWMPTQPCAAGETCSAGRCAATCVDECPAGAVECDAGGTRTCADHDADGCLDWGPIVPCPGGQTCSNGACSATCTDECTTTGCDKDAYRQCGQYDLDPCLDWSPGVSCAPSDPCEDASCSVSGCATTPKTCDDPPPAVCIDASTLRSYGAGTCHSDGGCYYTITDTTCPGGCADGACSGAFTCDADPYEPDDTLMNAVQLSVPFLQNTETITKVAVCPGGDVDLYTMSVITPPATVTAVVTFQAGAAPLQLDLLDGNGGVIGTSVPIGTKATLVGSGLFTGTYYWRVSSTIVGGENNYTLSVTAGS